MTPDQINACFEGGMAIAVSFSIHRLYKDKEVKGFSLAPLFFVGLWGYWNIVFYSGLEQWWSWAAGIALAIVNTIYTIMVIYYASKEKARIRARQKFDAEHRF